MVFGTERHDVDIAAVKPSFESNVPGIYIAGERGATALGKAAEQGKQAVDAIRNADHRGGDYEPENQLTDAG